MWGSVVHRDVYGGTAGRTRSPLIGRKAELDELQLLYRRAADGSGGAALLWGEAGVGKTRLLDEFSAFAAAHHWRVAATTCFEALCPPFAPLREAFGSLALPEPFVENDGSSAPLHRNTEGGKYQGFLAATRTLLEVAQTPIALLIDDLQWADFGTLEFLAFFTPRLTESRILVLGAVRSEYLERDHARAAALANVSHAGAATLWIKPLAENDMRALVARLWPRGKPLEDREIERLCALAEGKPYFAEELVSSVAMAREGPTFDLAPLSIRAGVLARFEQLASEDRRIVLHASVIGRSFAATLLARITESTDADVAATLTRTRDLQLVHEIRESPGVFTFRHAITREILYRELLAFQSQAIHRAIAESLANVPGADPLALAYHWSSAGNPEAASQAYERAGDDAMAGGAHRDAAVAYRGAVDSGTTAGVAYPLRCEKLSRALSINGEIEEACVFAERAVNAYEAAGETLQAASLAIRLARRIYESGRPEGAAATARRALQLSREQGPIAYDAYVTLAHFEALQSRNEAAVAALASAEATPGEHLATHRRNAHIVRALVSANSGRVVEAFEQYEAAVSLARELNDPEQLAWTLNNYASRAMATGWMDRALAAYREAAGCVPSDEFGKVVATSIQGLAFAELLAGNFAEVRARQRQDARLPAGIAMTQTARTALGVRLAYYCDDDTQANQLLTPEALELAFASGETQRIGLLAGCIAAYYDATGQPEEARALRSRALERIQNVDFSFWLLDQLAASASCDERERARKLLAQAATDPGHAAAQAHLALFDARVARLQRNAIAKSHAANAAAKFEAIGWPWERAQALELASRYADALTLYLNHGYLRHARDLERTRRRVRHRAGTDRLTEREAEIARLAAQGMSNRAIAAQLFIGERTIETHIAAIFDRFDLTSRTQLQALLDDSPQQVAAKDSS